jgi:hypothetical protein
MNLIQEVVSPLSLLRSNQLRLSDMLFTLNAISSLEGTFFLD